MTVINIFHRVIHMRYVTRLRKFYSYFGGVRLKKQKRVMQIVAIVVAVLLAVSLLWPVVASMAYGETRSEAALVSASPDGALVSNGIAFSDVSSISSASGDGYGELLADSYLYYARSAGAVGADENAMGAIAKDMIKAVLPAGGVTESDVRAVLAAAADGSDVPLVLFYVSAKDLRHIADLDASVGESDAAAQFFFSGVRYTYNPSRMLFDRVTDIVFIRGGSEYWPDSSILYPVVTDLQSAQAMLAAEGKSNKMLSFTPLDKGGNEITDFSACVVKDAGGKPAPAWSALESYLVSFGGSIPEAYAATDGRKICSDDSNVGAIVSNPGKATWLAIGLTAAICALLAVVAVRFIRRNLKKIEDDGPEDRLR